MEFNYMSDLKPVLPRFLHETVYTNNPLNSHFLNKKPVRYIRKMFLEKNFTCQLNFEIKILPTDFCLL